MKIYGLKPLPIKSDLKDCAGNEPAVFPRRPREELLIGGLTPFTTIDFPGKLSCVVFVKGCPWKCTYCHNFELQKRTFEEGEEPISWQSVEALLERRKGLLDAVVFSGGEPCCDGALYDAVRYAYEKGFSVGLHTAGMYPSRLKELTPMLDWVGLDVKAPLSAPGLYSKIIQKKVQTDKVSESLDIVLKGVPSYEVRTTAHPLLLSEADLLCLAQDLKSRGVQRFVLQIYRTPPEADKEHTLPPVSSDYPSKEALEALGTLFKDFLIRRP